MSLPEKPGEQAPDCLHIKGAREHNLRNLELKLPRHKLVVITGVSGSGKSSLAYDTLYAEGYRKYLDSLSLRNRSLLEQIPRPDIDFIHGLSPVIAIEQRASRSAHPRSNVATVTGISNYARLVWSFAGEQYCPSDGSRIERRTLEDAIEHLLAAGEGKRAYLLAPLLEEAPVSLIREEVERLRTKGYQRVRVGSRIGRLDDPQLLDGFKGSQRLEVVVDRLVISASERSRLADSLELAYREGGDRALALVETAKNEFGELVLSRELSSEGGLVYEPLTPRHLSPNYPEGACETCGGLGEVLSFSDELLVPEPELSLKKGAIKAWRLGSKQMIIRHNAILKQLAEQYPFDATTPWNELDEAVRHFVLHGDPDRTFSFRFSKGKAVEQPFAGVIADLEESFRKTTSEGLRTKLMRYQLRSGCRTCGGTGLSARARKVLVAGRDIGSFLSGSVEEAYAFTSELVESLSERRELGEAIHGLHRQLAFLCEVGLEYLTLERKFNSLSGGEAQRVRLAEQLGVGLTGVTYVLDEPSIGLHPGDQDRLIRQLVQLRDRGNTVLVVEHDESAIRAADHLVELGPGAGEEGGYLVYEGDPLGCCESHRSRTGPYLSGEISIHRESPQRGPGEGKVSVLGASEHNLKNIDAHFHNGLLTVVCGVSGSGKSTLINEVLGNEAARRLNRAKAIPGAHREIRGLECFRSVVRVDQDGIGRTPRSNPATYLKLFDPIRQLFAKAPLARVRGYTASRFSFNVRGGRCERCQGDGQISLDMQFIGEVFVECPSCRGKRYNRETLEVRYRGLNIAEVLNLTIREAHALFVNHAPVARKLETLESVGLGYLRLGQPANTLSGGEAQRIKLALDLSRRNDGDMLYLLDEPTTGLHWDDIQKLLDLLYRLRDQGHTLVIIEHHLDVIAQADWVMELGPEGGAGGGEIIFEGTPASLAREETPTGKALGAHLRVRQEQKR